MEIVSVSGFNGVRHPLLVLPPRVSVQFVQLSPCRHSCDLPQTCTISQAPTAVACAISALLLPQLSVKRINNWHEQILTHKHKPLGPCENHALCSGCKVLRSAGTAATLLSSANHCDPELPGQGDPDSEIINNIFPAQNV